MRKMSFNTAARDVVLRSAAAVLMIFGILQFYRLLPVNNTTVALSLLLAILGISAWWGLVAATVASVVAMLGFNFWFLPPVGTLTIQDPENWVAIAAFMATAITANQLAEHARRRTQEAEARRIEVERLYALLQAMLFTGNARKTTREFVHRAVQVFGCSAAAIYYRPAEEVVRSGPESKVVSDHELHVAAETEGLRIDGERNVVTAAVRLGGRPLGSLALMGPLPTEQTLRAIVNLVALTIEKARALEDASYAEAARQSETLKSALLDSLAHDIKTPLTSIKAAVGNLLGGNMQRELLTIIDEEADRLNRIAAEVIAMGRIEAGKLHLEKGPVNVGEFISKVVREFDPVLMGRKVAVTVPQDLPPAEADAEFVEQVLKQIIENALRYSPEESPVSISAELKGGKIVIGVGDRGPGIEDNERSRIFERYYRGRQHRFSTRGTGMGLAIAKGIVEAHGERIWVESEPGQGAVFYFSLAVAGDGKY
jgi:two-component system, OmpR family, sensor histidine kinase KdpD